MLHKLKELLNNPAVVSVLTLLSFLYFLFSWMGDRFDDLENTITNEVARVIEHQATSADDLNYRLGLERGISLGEIKRGFRED